MSTKTDYDKLLPKRIIFSLKEIEEMSSISLPMLKKMIANAQIERVKIGNKNHISRIELIRLLTENTIVREQK